MQNFGLTHRIIDFFKKETVLSISILLAVFSAFFVKPGLEYLSYIDFQTLAILFCLMLIVAGMKRLGVFDLLAENLLKRTSSSAEIIFLLVMLCFFFSMFITNDVALITFVPFTIAIMHKMPSAFLRQHLLPTVAMQTIAANLGSMLTPIGNPQNLYLYTNSGMSLLSMLKLMLPYSAAALAMLLVWVALQIKKSPDSGTQSGESVFENETVLSDKRKLAVYLILFSGCLLCVAHIIPFQIMLILILAYVLLCDASVLGDIDYSLLLTFTALFIFIGNLGRVPEFSILLENLMQGHETLTAVIASQVMSNVPAAILLSEFTSDYSALIVGTNIGGLGTLIASMASLISFKYIAKENRNLRWPYMGIFTASNLVFLLIMLGMIHHLA